MNTELTPEQRKARVATTRNEVSAMLLLMGFIPTKAGDWYSHPRLPKPAKVQLHSDGRLSPGISCSLALGIYEGAGIDFDKFVGVWGKYLEKSNDQR